MAHSQNEITAVLEYSNVPKYEVVGGEWAKSSVVYLMLLFSIQLKTYHGPWLGKF